MRNLPVRGTSVAFVAFLALGTFAPACGQHNTRPIPSGCVSPPSGGSAAWPEADQLFRHDPDWLGADGAYSVGLPDGRVLWFFDDTFISTGSPRDRRHATLVHNSVGVQSDPDPSRATIQFYWRRGLGGPGSFFADPSPSYYWMGAPAVVAGKVLLFLGQVVPTSSGLGFQYVGWSASLIDNPGDSPDHWNVRRLDPSPVHASWYVGQAGVLVDGTYLYAHVTEDVTLNAYLLRYPLGAAAAGDLSAPEWWCGDAAGWVGASNGPQPQVVLASAGTEFSVQREASGRFVMATVTAPYLTGGHLTFRTASAIQGPWSAASTVYDPPEAHQSRVIVYAGKSHPELTGAPVVLTYASNSLDLPAVTDDMCLYFPRFVRAALP